jgi:glycosyltransferase involved in cell wall biosynthesis
VEPRVVRFLIPGDPDTRTGGYAYDRRVMAGLRALGWCVERWALGGGFPFPARGEVEDARRVLAGLPDRALVVVDGLALGPMPEVIEAEAGRLRLVALVHHPLALETGLDSETARRLDAGERRALRAAARVVATSPSTARSLAAAGIPAGRLGVVTPGNDPAPLATGGGSRPATEILCVATLTPRKGHEVLLRALARVRGHPWHLTCVGSQGRHPATARAVRALAGRLGLRRRVAFRGEVDDRTLSRCYRRADLVVLASFHEGYGMVLAEALARGIPVVSTRVGAIPDTVPPAAGRLVPPGDPGALARALEGVLGSRRLRARLAGGARAVRRRLPSWTETSRRFAAELERALEA